MLFTVYNCLVKTLAVHIMDDSEYLGNTGKKIGTYAQVRAVDDLAKIRFFYPEIVSEHAPSSVNSVRVGLYVVSFLFKEKRKGCRFHPSRSYQNDWVS